MSADAASIVSNEETRSQLNLPMGTETASIFSETATLVPERDDEDEVDMQRFTAIGRPMKAYKSSGLQNLNVDSTAGQAPQFLPVRFTDDSLLRVPISYADLPLPETDSEAPAKEKKSSIFGKLSGKKGKLKERFRMVEMTRREYLMYWAKNEKGEYIGTEPEGSRIKIWRQRGY